MRYAIPSAHDPVEPEYLWLLQDLDRKASLLDSRYPIPFTRVRFGWDAIVGLLPVVGDVVTAAVGLHLVHRACRLGADGRVASRMVLNVAVDALLGAIPIVGTVFDVYFRANERNLRLLFDHIERHRRSRA
ncbi:MAG: DUF4112 domain-containing protein [Hyphomicrobiaceae bacterium]